MVCDDEFCQNIEQEDDGSEADSDEGSDNAKMSLDSVPNRAATGNSSRADVITEIENLLEEVGEDTLLPPLDGTAFYFNICRVNHSCDPNVIVKYISDPDCGLMAAMTVLRPIQAGEELLQSYVEQSLPFLERKNALDEYGFECTCTLCMEQRNQVGTNVKS